MRVFDPGRHALVIAVAIVCAASVGRRSVALSPAISAEPSLHRLAQVPAELELPAVASRHASAIVAADIDADGDLDVVVNEGSLDLAVWVNDGTGRLTRKRAAQTSGWQAEPLPPSLNPHVPTVSVSVQNDLPSIGDDARASLVTLAPVPMPRPISADALPASAIGASTPRAPPTRS